MTIHREGHPLLYSVFFILLAINILLIYFKDNSPSIIIVSIVFSLVLMILLLQFFRSPSRDFIQGEKLIVAPADGKVVAVEETFEPEYYKDKRIQVSIFMSPFDVHINWYPVSGKIKYLCYHSGKYLIAWHPKASTLNERTTIVIEKENKSILLRQIAGALAKRIVYYPHEGDMVKQSSELGFIKFGSRVDVFLPLGTKINVKVNDKTKGGVTIIGEWPS
jgi:phosphatidylserine decarboxylase